MVLLVQTGGRIAALLNPPTLGGNKVVSIQLDLFIYTKILIMPLPTLYMLYCMYLPRHWSWTSLVQLKIPLKTT